MLGGRSRAMPYFWPSMKRHFPMLLVVLPRAARTLPRIARRWMTRRRLIAAAVLMFVIALVGLIRSLLDERRQRYEAIASEHESKVIVGTGCSLDPTRPPIYTDSQNRVMTWAEVNASTWHEILAKKYRTAAAAPWRPVTPDPPPP